MKRLYAPSGNPIIGMTALEPSVTAQLLSARGLPRQEQNRLLEPILARVNVHSHDWTYQSIPEGIVALTPWSDRWHFAELEAADKSVYICNLGR